jgi:hypothetical protein
MLSQSSKRGMMVALLTVLLAVNVSLGQPSRLWATEELPPPCERGPGFGLIDVGPFHYDPAVSCQGTNECLYAVCNCPPSSDPWDNYDGACSDADETICMGSCVGS